MRGRKRSELFEDLLAAGMLFGVGILLLALEMAPWVVLLAAGCFAVAAYARRQLHLRGVGDDRRDAGKCLSCGYDLRATPGRCPECGRVEAPAVE